MRLYFESHRRLMSEESASLPLQSSGRALAQPEAEGSLFALKVRSGGLKTGAPAAGESSYFLVIPAGAGLFLLRAFCAANLELYPPETESDARKIASLFLPDYVCEVRF